MPHNKWINETYSKMCKVLNVKEYPLIVTDEVLNKNWLGYLTRTTSSTYYVVVKNGKRWKKGIKTIKENTIAHITIKESHVKDSYEASLKDALLPEAIKTLLHEISHYEFDFHRKRRRLCYRSLVQRWLAYEINTPRSIIKKMLKTKEFKNCYENKLERYYKKRKLI